MPDTMMMFEPLSVDAPVASPVATQSSDKTPIIPVPPDAPPMRFRHPKYGQPTDTREDFSKKQQLTQSEIGQTLKERWKITPPTNCQGCHR